MAVPLGPMVRSMVRQAGPSTLVVLELATGFTTICCLLLASGWYFGLTTKPSGYDDADLIMVALERPAAASDRDGAARAAARTDAEITARMRAVSAVAAFTPVSTHLLDQRWNYPVELAAWPAEDPARTAVGWTIHTGAGIAEVLGLRVLEGTLPRPDESDLAKITVLTRCLRDRLFAGPALGRQIRADDAPVATVVAVVEDVVLRDPWNANGSCVSLRFGWPADDREARYLARARPGRRPEALAALRATLGDSGPTQRIALEPFEPRRSHYFRMARGLGGTLALFGVVIVLCVLLGTLTVSYFLVSERSRSIGIRRALGARPGDIIRYFLVETAILAVLGVAGGMALTTGVFLMMRQLYPGLRLAAGPLLVTAVLLWMAATLGALLPARRAAAIPPSSATRTV
jgi:putative ABC transport system permease protein